jgi:hypothetical protein
LKLQEVYSKACYDFVEKIKKDKNILCIILGGSLHYGFVGEASDINLIVIVKDGKRLEGAYSCIENEVVIDVDVLERSKYLKTLSLQEGSPHFFAYLTNSHILYSIDPALENFISEFNEIGKDAYDINIFFDATEILYYMHVIRKWLDGKQDTIYAQFNFVMISEDLSKLEHYFNRIVIARDKTVAARNINPELMKYFHEDALTQKWTIKQCYEALDLLDAYIMTHIDDISNPIKKLFTIKEKEVLTISEIAKHYSVYAGFANIGYLYLAKKGIIGQTTVSVPLSDKSKIYVEELAYHL